MSNYINRILSATWYPDICKDQTDYKVLAKHLHSDLNKDKDAIMAFTHLNNFNNRFEIFFNFSY